MNYRPIYNIYLKFIIRLLTISVILSLVTSKLSYSQNHQSELDSLLEMHFTSNKVLHDSIHATINKTINLLEREINKQDSVQQSIHSQVIELRHSSKWWDWINLILGFIGGLIVSIITLALTYGTSIRNFLFKEFSVSLAFNKAETSGEEIKMIELLVEINYVNPDPLFVGYIYLVIPPDIAINSHDNAPLGERMLGTKGKFFVRTTTHSINQYHKEIVTITNSNILRLINEEKLMKYQVVVSTAKYGKVKSNKVTWPSLKQYKQE